MSITMAADSTQRDLTSKLRGYEDNKSKKKKRISYSYSSSSSSSSSEDDCYREKKSKIKRKKIKKKVKSQTKLSTKSGSKTKKEGKSSDSDCSSDLDLEKELLPIVGYVANKEDLLSQMLRSISTHKLKEMMPEILKPYAMAEIKSLCLEELEGMSKKRIEHILDGRISEEISSSDEASNMDDDVDERVSEKEDIMMKEKDGLKDESCKEEKKSSVDKKKSFDKNLGEMDRNVSEDKSVSTVDKSQSYGINKNEKINLEDNVNIGVSKESSSTSMTIYDVKDKSDILIEKTEIVLNKNVTKKTESELIKDEGLVGKRNNAMLETKESVKVNNNENIENDIKNGEDGDEEKNNENKDDNNDNSIDSCYEIQCYAPEIVIDNASDDDEEGVGIEDENTDIRQVISNTNQSDSIKMNTNEEELKSNEVGLEEEDSMLGNYNDKTQLEILELEMRARAIKAMLRVQEEVEKKVENVKKVGDVKKIVIPKKQGLVNHLKVEKVTADKTLPHKGELAEQNVIKYNTSKNKQLVRNNNPFENNINISRIANVGQARNKVDSHFTVNVSNDAVKEFKQTSRTVFIPSTTTRVNTTKMFNTSFGINQPPKSPNIRRIIKYERAIQRPYQNNRFVRNNSDDDDDDDDMDSLTVE